MFNTIASLRPYFHSLREIENNVSLDIKLPISWKYESLLAPYRSIKPKIQDKNDRFTLISLISNATSEGYDVVFSCAEEIIRVNKENEEKQRLFNEKVKELEAIFKEQSLDKLKVLSFKDERDEQEDRERIELAPEGDGEGPEGDRDPQESGD